MDKLVAIEEAIGKHVAWMSLIREAVLEAPTGIDVESIRADDRCEFGQWLYASHWLPEERATEYYQDVRRVHAAFHDLAAKVAMLAASGRAVEAYTLLYGEYVTMSGRLAIALRAWQAALRRGG